MTEVKQDGSDSQQDGRTQDIAVSIVNAVTAHIEIDPKYRTNPQARSLIEGVCEQRIRETIGEWQHLQRKPMYRLRFQQEWIKANPEEADVWLLELQLLDVIAAASTREGQDCMDVHRLMTVYMKYLRKAFDNP